MTSQDLQVGAYYLATSHSGSQLVMCIESRNLGRIYYEDYYSDGQLDTAGIGSNVMDRWLSDLVEITPISEEKAHTLISVWCDVQLG